MATAAAADEEDPTPSDDLRARIVTATSDLIAEGGRDAATTRAIATAAGVQAPTIYRLFGDKRGLLDAVAERGMAAYIADKARRPPHPDPVQDLRNGWDAHVAFGLAHPGLFAIMSGDPRPRAPSPATAAGLAVLRRRVGNIARAGQLRVSEKRALALLHAACVGTVLTLLGQPEGERDDALSESAREAVVAAIVAPRSATERRQRATMAIRSATPRAAAAMLRASLDDSEVLSAGERHLLAELLDRIADDVRVRPGAAAPARRASKRG